MTLLSNSISGIFQSFMDRVWDGITIFMLSRCVEIGIFFKTWRRNTSFTPFSIRHLFCHHVQTNDFEVFLERTRCPHGILLDSSKQALWFHHIFG
mmetsp:Transcript_33359/g.67355  ORF Transcript_33359/g.67355 Transcript_33359/m.67355 type:complete len:95 (+) Transcript_33359:95-379(+)